MKIASRPFFWHFSAYLLLLIFFSSWYLFPAKTHAIVADFDPTLEYETKSRPDTQYTPLPVFGPNLPESGSANTAGYDQVVAESPDSKPWWRRGLEFVAEAVKTGVAYSTGFIADKIENLKSGIQAIASGDVEGIAQSIALATLATIPTVGALASKSVRHLFTKAIETGITLAKTVLQSAGDLVLHAGAEVRARANNVLTGVPLDKARQESRQSVISTFGRDPGDWRGDLAVIGLTLATAAVIYAVPVLAGAVAKAGGIGAFASQTGYSTYFYLTERSVNAGQETVNECMVQCHNLMDVAITIAFNIFPYDFELDHGLISAKNFAIDEIAKNSDDMVKYSDNILGFVGKSGDDVARATGKVATILTRDSVEARIGKQATKEIFGEATGEEFEQIARQWPETLSHLDETQGHVFQKHVIGEKELYERKISEGKEVVSTYSSSKLMLDSTEKALQEATKTGAIENWLRNVGRDTLVIEHEMDQVIGKVLNASDQITDARKIKLVLKKQNEDFFILTNYVE